MPRKQQGQSKTGRKRVRKPASSKPSGGSAKRELRNPSPRNLERALRDHLVNLLDGRGAHVSFAEVVGDFPPKLRCARPAELPFTPWQLLEHMRIAQWDILEFSRNSQHISPEWPAGYWPESDAPPNAAAWDRSIRAFGADLRAMKRLIRNASTDLAARIPHGTGQTILREALLVADHNAYHLGQLVMLRRLLGAWPGKQNAKNDIASY